MSKLETEDKQKVFLRLYEPVHARLSRYCQVQVTDYDEARDLMGETVMIAYEKFEKPAQSRHLPLLPVWDCTQPCS